MKIKIHLKDPDGVYDSRNEAAKASLKNMVGLSENERKALYEIRREEIIDQTSPWIEYGEYVTIEIDTETNTAIVIKKD